MSQPVTTSLQDEVIELLRTERFTDATALINQTRDPQYFFGQTERAYGKIYTEFVLAQNIEGMKLMWQHGANEMYNRDNQGILECIKNYATTRSQVAPAFNNDMLMKALADTETFYRETGGLEPEQFYHYATDLSNVLKGINEELRIAVMFSTKYPGVAQRIEDFGDKFIPFLEQRIAQLEAHDIKPLDNQSGWQNGVYSLTETLPYLVETFQSSKTVNTSRAVQPSLASDYQ